MISQKLYSQKQKGTSILPYSTIENSHSMRTELRISRNILLNIPGCSGPLFNSELTNLSSGTSTTVQKIRSLHVHTLVKR